MRILVTGGAGFVGSHLVDKLLEYGHDITVVDDISTGNLNNIASHLQNPRFKFIHADIVGITISEIPTVDQIYHLASPASPPKYQASPLQTIKTNTIGTLNLLELAQRCKARFLLASTSEIYGDPDIHPQPESYYGNVNTFGPRACYDESKRLAETIVYEHRLKVETRIVRIFNTFGPKMDPYDGRVITNFIRQALNNEDITIYGDGAQTRSFMYIDDLVDGLIACMNGNYSAPVNLGNPEEFTVRDMAKIICQEVGKSPKIITLPAVIDDPRQRKPDITIAMKELSWSPKRTVYFGLNETIKYMRSVQF